LVIALPLLFISCESDGNKADTVTIDPTVDNVKDGVSVVIGTTLDMTADAIEAYDERAEAESNGTLNKSTAGIVYEDGWWKWENTVAYGEFLGDFSRKSQFRVSENGPVVQWPSQADYMTAEVTASGKYGYPEDGNHPGYGYGTTFDHHITSTVTGMKSMVRTVSGTAHVRKFSELIYNGEDAELLYEVDVNLERLQWTRTKIGESINIEGTMSITMDEWHAMINCDANPGNPYADVEIYEGGKLVKEFKYDMNNFRHRGLINGMSKF
jgi:hypothetical protein